MSADIRAIRLHNPKQVWWGNPETVTEISKGVIQVGERPSEAAKTIGIYDVVTTRKELGYMVGDNFVAVGDYRLVHTNVPWQTTPQEISRTVKNYTPLQNHMFFDMVDQVADYLQLEGIGMLGKEGEFTFVQFKMGEYDIGGNPNETHLEWLIFDDNKSGNGFTTGQVDTRVVCTNTRRLAIRDLEPLPHTDDLGVYLRYITQAYLTALEQNYQRRATLDRLFTSKLPDVNKAIRAIFPTQTPGRNLRNLSKIVGFDIDTLVAKDTIVTDDVEIQNLVDKEITRYRNDITRNEDRRSALADAFFAFNDAYPYAANTSYAMWNATTFVTSHGEDLTKANGKQLFYNDPSGLSLMYGERARINDRAWYYLTK